jgi:hypothetical protein
VGRKAVYSPEEKLQIVLSVLRGETTQTEVSRRLQMSQTTIAKWQRQFLDGGAEGLAREQVGELRLEAVGQVDEAKGHFVFGAPPPLLVSLRGGPRLGVSSWSGAASARPSAPAWSAAATPAP